MNKKQRVLTVIALIAFVVIGACHYVAWPPLHLISYETKKRIVNWELLDWEKAKKQMESNEEKWFSANDFDLAFAHVATFTHGYVDVSGNWQPYTYTEADPTWARSSIPRDAKVWVPELRVFSEPSLDVWVNFASRYDAIVLDVRIPWFMLGVIYVGLFFLLADRKGS